MDRNTYDFTWNTIICIIRFRSCYRLIETRHVVSVLKRLTFLTMGAVVTVVQYVSFKNPTVVWFLAWICMMVADAQTITAGNGEDRLYNKYFLQARRSRPVMKSSNPLHVHLTINLRHIDQVVEQRQLITGYMLITLEWQDEFINWKPVDYDDVHETFVPGTQIWRPQVSLLNSIDRYSLHSSAANGMVKVNASGIVVWQIHVPFTTSCEMSLQAFPFDRQECHFIFIDELYRDQVVIKTNQTTLDLTQVKTSGEWSLLESRVRSLSDKNFGKTLTFSLKIERNFQEIVVGVILPLVCLALLSLATFGTAAQTNEKVAVGLLTCVAYFIMLWHINDITAKGIGSASVLVIYMASICVVISLSVLCTILVTKLHTHNPKARLPRSLRLSLFGRLAWFLCMRHIIPNKSSYQLDHKIRKRSSFSNPSMSIADEGNENVTTIRFELTQEGKIYNTLETMLTEIRSITSRIQALKDIENTREEWMAAARVLDRLFLVIFLVVHFVLILAILIIYPTTMSF